MHHPRASKSSAGISPSRKARQNCSTLGLGGVFHIHIRSSAHGAVSQGPVPLPLTWSPVLPDPAMPRHVPRGGLQGHRDHFNWSGKEGLAFQPSASRASLCREVWEQLGGAGQRQIRSFISMFRKSHSWKRNPASFLLPPNHQLRDLGECLAWVCTSASTFWPCILSIQHGCKDAAASHAQMCPWRVACAQVPPHLHCAVSGLTQHCSHSGQVWGSGPKQHPLSLAELSRLGWELCWCGLCSPLSPADLGTVAQCQARTNPAGRARQSGWEARRCLELPQLPWLVLNTQNWSWEGRPAMQTLKVANKALIKSTWKEQPCQKERQRHKSLSLFNGLCLFIHGGSWPLCPVWRVVYSPGYKTGRRAVPTLCTKKAGSSPGPVGMDPGAGASPLLFARDSLPVAGKWQNHLRVLQCLGGKWHLWGKPPM